MSNSSIDDELFGEDYPKLKFNGVKIENPPSYYNEDSCRDFLQQEGIRGDVTYGYSYLHFYKNYYFPGQTVRGYFYLDLFNDVNSPNSQAQSIVFKIKGKEFPGKHSRAIKKKLRQDPESFIDQLQTITVSHSQIGDDTVQLQQDLLHFQSTGEQGLRQKSHKNLNPSTLNQLNISAKTKQGSLKKRQMSYKNFEPSTNPQSPLYTNLTASQNIVDTKSNNYIQGPPQKRKIQEKHSTNKLEILESIFSLSKKETRTIKDKHSIAIFDNQVTGFTFKQKCIEKGKYKFPFSFTLPTNVPGSFKYQNSTGDLFQIQYTVEAFLENMQDIIYCQKEFVVREFLFTSQEIDADWIEYQHVINLRSILIPISSLAIDVSRQDKERKLVHLRQNEQNRSQSLLTSNKSWSMDHQIISAKCLCFQTNYLVKLRASINKQLFYPDEVVKVSFEVDNSRSARDIKIVTCTLTHNLQIMKGQHVVQELNFDLKLIQFKGINKGCVQNTKEFLFNLEQIFQEYKQSGKCLGVDKNEIRRRKKEIINRISIKRESKCDSVSSTQKFHRQLSKFLETTDEFTFYTVTGVSIKSSFSVDVSFTVSDLFGDTVHSKKFPIAIRAFKNGQFINENDLNNQNQCLIPNQTQQQNSYLQKVPEFIKSMESQMFSLPGCNFNIELGTRGLKLRTIKLSQFKQE
eukprot:403353261